MRSQGQYHQTMNWGNQPSPGDWGNHPSPGGNGAAPKETPIADPMDAARDRRQETRREMNMPLGGMPLDKIDELLSGANANGLDKGFWTPDRIKNASELNRRQAAAKLMSKHAGANPNRVHESQLDELWLMKNRGTPEPQLHPKEVMQQIRQMGLKVGFMDGEFVINYPSGARHNAFRTSRPYDALKTAKRMRAIMMRDGYPDTSYETDEPSHESRVGDLRAKGHQKGPQAPALNKEYMGAYELHVEKIHEMAEKEMERLLRGTAARLGYKNIVFEEEDETDEETEPTEAVEGAIPRVRARWVGEAGHLPSPKRPLPGNIAGSGKNFRPKPGVNKSKKQPGNLVGSNKVNKVKPGFVG